MIWEDLKVYKPLKRDELKPAFRAFAMLIGKQMKAYGFKKKGRRLFRLSHDLLEVIDIDYRGSWTGQDSYFTTNIGLVPLCWPDLSKEYYLIAAKDIKEIDKSIRDHNRITKEYELLADFLCRRIIKNVLPYFEKYNSTKKIIDHSSDFKFLNKQRSLDINQTSLLILCSELKQHQIQRSLKIIDRELEHLNEVKNSKYRDSKFDVDAELSKWNNLKSKAAHNKWDELDATFTQTEKEEIAKLKIKYYKPEK